MTHSFAPSGNTHLGFNMCLICHEAEHLHQPANDKGGSAGERDRHRIIRKVFLEGHKKGMELQPVGSKDIEHYLDEFDSIVANYVIESTRRELLALESRITQLQTYKMFDSADAEKLVELKDIKAELRKRISELEGGQS